MLDSLFEKYDALVIFDTETTGLNCASDNIIELAAIRVEKSGITHQVDRLIKLPPFKKITSEITNITGITNEKLASEGVDKKIAEQDFLSLLKGSPLLVAYNAQFDLCFLYYFLLSSQNQKKLILDKLDPLTIYRDRRDYPHKLENAVAAYNLTTVINSHRALDDCLAAFEVLKAMDEEESDLHKYINLFGYHPKYAIQGVKIASVTYLPQPFLRTKKLYE